MHAARNSEGALTKRTRPQTTGATAATWPSLALAAPHPQSTVGTVKRAAIYVRVSTTNRTRDGNGFEQNPEVQEVPLRQLVHQRGWTLIRVYSDRLSGAKENRPGLRSLMEDARRGLFDVVLAVRSLCPFDRATGACPGGVQGAWNRLRVLPGSVGHFYTYGQGHVYDHRRYGGTGTERHPRTRHRGIGVRPSAWYEERECHRPAEAHFRPRRSGPTTGVRFVDRENRRSDASRCRDSRAGHPGPGERNGYLPKPFYIDPPSGIRGPEEQNRAKRPHC